MVPGFGKNDIWKSIPILGADVKGLLCLNWVMELSEPCLLSQILELLQHVKRWGKKAAKGLSHRHQESSASSLLRSDTGIGE